MKTYTPEQKARAIAAFLGGLSLSAISREQDIPKGTLAKWTAKVPAEGETIGTQKKRTIAEQLMELVETEIESLRQISVVTRDPQWLKNQSAGDLAIFNGVKHDKLYRILEAFSASSRTTED